MESSRDWRREKVKAKMIEKELEALQRFDQIRVESEKANGNWELIKFGAYFCEFFAFLGAILVLMTLAEGGKLENVEVFTFGIFNGIGSLLHVMPELKVNLNGKRGNEKEEIDIYSYLRYMPISTKTIFRERNKQFFKLMRNRGIVIGVMLVVACFIKHAFLWEAGIKICLLWLLLCFFEWVNIVPWKDVFRK